MVLLLFLCLVSFCVLLKTSWYFPSPSSNDSDLASLRQACCKYTSCSSYCFLCRRRMLLGHVRRRSDLHSRQTRRVVEVSLLEIGSHSLHRRDGSIFLFHLEMLVRGSTCHLVLCYVFFRVYHKCYFGEVCCSSCRKRMMVVLRMYTVAQLVLVTLSWTRRRDCRYIYLLLLDRWKYGMYILLRYMLAADRHTSASSSQRLVLRICRNPV